MAVRAGMLRLGRLCAGGAAVLGPRAVLCRGRQEAGWPGVRPIRYGAREERGRPVPREGFAQLLDPWGARGSGVTPPGQQETPAEWGAAGAGADPAPTLGSGPGLREP